MKSDHRHELKTNELADWIAHFPEWARENRMTLVATAAVVVVAIGVYVVKFRWGSTISVQNHVRLTGLIDELSSQGMMVAQIHAGGGDDQSHTLLPIARDLQAFAATVGDRRMAALALIKHADGLRMQLHSRLGQISQEDLAAQIAEAKASYERALDQAGSIPDLAATARFGIGLCEEESGHFEQAKEIYRDVVENAAYAGAAVRQAAARRLGNMDDYRSTVVFRVAPAAATAPSMEIPSVGAEPPITITLPAEATEAMTDAAADETAETTRAVPETAAEETAEANAPAEN